MFRYEMSSNQTATKGQNPKKHSRNSSSIESHETPHLSPLSVQNFPSHPSNHPFIPPRGDFQDQLFTRCNVATLQELSVPAIQEGSSPSPSGSAIKRREASECPVETGYTKRAKKPGIAGASLVYPVARRRRRRHRGMERWRTSRNDAYLRSVRKLPDGRTRAGWSEVEGLPSVCIRGETSWLGYRANYLARHSGTLFRDKGGGRLLRPVVVPDTLGKISLRSCRCTTTAGGTRFLSAAGARRASGR
ncbi:hypothetical protein K0M31_011478 [Melipona bicolor]|uniref:Uncharacterized protein n=1 Tax=Melipona bicolor TaxID=60889 RepID=A0AA40KUX8_9HYME|nr:hypothetical protein K0M31_011478 [Melipona bicolor]